MTHQAPSVGRVVHYTSYGTPGGEYGKECRAAIITEVGSGLLPEIDTIGGREIDSDAWVVGLCVLNPTGMFFNRGVLQEELDGKIEPGPAGRTGGTWHWPERV